jgi:hypothetical protein
MVKSAQGNAILELVHQVLGQMFCTAEIDMAESVTLDDVDVFLDIWHGKFALPIIQYLKPHQAPGAAIFGQDILFNIPLVADWHKIGEHRQ